MNKRYCDEIWEKQTTFVTMCYVIIERIGKQKIAFLEVAWFTIWKKVTELSLKGTWKTNLTLEQFCGLHTSTVILTKPTLEYTSLLKLEKICTKHENMVTIFIKEIVQETSFCSISLIPVIDF